MKVPLAPIALLAAILSSFAAHAVTESVTFDDALTNRTDETKWEYKDGFGYVKTKKAFAFTKKLGNGEDQVVSQVFDFAITSVVLHAEKASDKTTRNLMYRALSGKADQSTHELVVDIVPEEQVAFTSRWEWAQSDRVRSFALTTTNGTGNVYLYSAEISGCNICPQPQNVEARELQGTRFTLSWENGEGVVSNRVDVLEVRRVPEQGELADRYDFEDDAFVGGTSALSFDPYGHEDYLCFTNSVNLFVADNTNGVLQISNSSKSGVLVYEGPGTVGDTTLFLVARKHPNDTASTRTMSIGWTVDDGVETNFFPDVTLGGSDFSVFRIPLTNMLDNAALIMHPKDDTAAKGRRIWIDEMTFVRDYAEAYVATNALPPVVTSQGGLRLRGLAAKTLYIATVTAYDEEGNPSEPAGPIEVRTKACNPETLIFIR